jgi:hypothetical protein
MARAVKAAPGGIRNVTDWPWKIASALLGFALLVLGYNARRIDAKVDETANTQGEHATRLATLEEAKRSGEQREKAAEARLTRIETKLDRLLERGA